MFRKLLIATVASLSFLAPLAIPAESQAAHPVHRVYRSHAVRPAYRAPNHFRVYYRNGTGAWNCGVTYQSRAAALRAASNYRSRGFQCYVR